jgi:hypothetical protein
MAVKRRPSPTEDDFDRIAESIMNIDKFHKIKDFQSFEEAYDDYFADCPEWLEDSHFKNEVFENVTNKYKVEDSRETTGKPKASKRGIRGRGVEHEFVVIGNIKEKIVYSYLEEITRYNRKIIVHRAKNGQFVKVTK